ncbi:hypothetical protein B0H13DRAFT_2263941 [Mycena leptocephala]|nr:hypothetical protein B0H13DRAFT_2263941 [Mycena leptocephala]
MATHAEPRNLDRESASVSSRALALPLRFQWRFLGHLGPVAGPHSFRPPELIPQFRMLRPIYPHLRLPPELVPWSLAVDLDRQIVITRQLEVDEIFHRTSVPSTYDVPRKPTAILVDLSGSAHLLVTPDGKLMPVDKFIRGEVESWDVSGGHAKGDVAVRGFFPDLEKEVWCLRVTLKCNGIDKCHYLDPTLFTGLERYEADEEAMRLWNHELNQNEVEAASPFGIIARYAFAGLLFYWLTSFENSLLEFKTRNAKLSVTECQFSFLLRIFIGCSKWKRLEKDSHLYWPMPLNVNQEVLWIVMQNEGHLPTGPTTLNHHCVLTVHPRVGLKNSPYSHIIDGKITPAELNIVNAEIDGSEVAQWQVFISSVGFHDAQGEYSAASTSSVYDGGRVAESSPAFVDTRKVRDFISAQKKLEHPNGLGWEGVLYHLNTREVKLSPRERYIHTAMYKNGFRLVVTMHPQIANEPKTKWMNGKSRVFVDRFKKPYNVIRKTQRPSPSFLSSCFDTIHHIMGQRLKIAPFYPDAKCRIVMLDGEVPQGLGFVRFLATYNDPEISQIWTSGPIKLLAYCLKTCSIHFGRHIDELPQVIPKSVIAQLKSIMAIDTQPEIDKWREACVGLGQKHEAIQNWYAHKIANPWVLTSITKFLSKIAPEDWDITPNHSNYSQESDNVKAQELVLLQRDGILPKRWNGRAEREKLAAASPGPRTACIFANICSHTDIFECSSDKRHLSFVQ